MADLFIEAGIKNKKEHKITYSNFINSKEISKVIYRNKEKYLYTNEGIMLTNCKNENDILDLEPFFLSGKKISIFNKLDGNRKDQILKILNYKLNIEKYIVFPEDKYFWNILRIFNFKNSEVRIFKDSIRAEEQDEKASNGLDKSCIMNYSEYFETKGIDDPIVFNLKWIRSLKPMKLFATEKEFTWMSEDREMLIAAKNKNELRNE